MAAYGQIDERRRFTETVLSGCVRGGDRLDEQGRVELPNRAASDELLRIDLNGEIGSRLDALVPEVGALLGRSMLNPERPADR